MVWYHDEVTSIENRPVPAKQVDKKRVVFYGSSSLRLWTSLESDFPEIDAVNVAFGGSTLAACCWYFERIVPAQKPDAIVVYAGDNDLGDGRHPEEVYLFFKNIMALIQQFCGDIPVAFISIKPSLSRIYLANSIIFANKLIQAEIEKKYPQGHFVSIYHQMLENGIPNPKLFQPDGLHLSGAGYVVWKKIIWENFLMQFANGQHTT